MFDSNAFDKLMEIGGSIDFWNQSSSKYTYYITHIQVEELASIPDDKKEKRIANFIQLTMMRAVFLPAPAICGLAICGCATLAGKEDSETFEELGNGSKSHKKDDVIGTVAKREECTVITNDIKFRGRLKNNDVSTMTFEEWRATL